jgi:hypothetical protein
MASAELTPQAIVPEEIISKPGTKTTEMAETSFSYEILPLEQKPRPVLIVGSAMIKVGGKVAEGRPTSILFGALRDPQLRLRKPIPLKIEVKEGLVSAIFEEIQEFGCGKTMSEAVSDFSSVLVELYVRLSEEAVPLSDDLQRIKSTLADYIEARSR